VLCGLGRLLVLGGIGLLGLVGLAGENDKAGLVLLQALDVGGEALLREVLAAGIDRDTDGASIVLGDAGSLFSCQNLIPFLTNGARAGVSYLDLSQREATAETGAAVVLDGAVNRN
jgi:hypothetical protein